MKTIRLTIEGMTCGHCVMAVRKALGALRGVTVLEAAIGSALVSLDAEPADEQALVEAVSDAGYTVSEIAETAGT